MRMLRSQDCILLRRRWAHAAAVLLLLPCATGFAAGRFPDTPPPVHASSPFLRLLGVPRFETELAYAEQSIELSLDLVSHADRGQAGDENIVLDGESLYLDIALHKRLTDRFALGIDVPFVNHSGGSLDRMIEAWHGLFGLTNAHRGGPANELSIVYADAGQTLLQVQDARSGLGDIRAKFAWQLSNPVERSGPSISVTSQVEFPTGDTDSLSGNGAADVSVGLVVVDVFESRLESISLSATAGITWPGNGNLVERRRLPRIAYGGVDLAWRASTRWQAHATLYGHTAGFDSELPELGRGSLQLAIAGRRQMRSEPRLFLDLGIVEDLVSDSTPDFAAQVALRIYW
jgi:hypothetical protein